MRMHFALPALLICLAASLGCEPESTEPGSSTTVVTPAPGGERAEVHVTPGNVDVDVSPHAAPASQPVNVDVAPGGGVNVDVNPQAVEEVGERIRERREERREAAETP